MTRETPPVLDPLLRCWEFPPPETQHVSGIRELPFSRALADCLVADGAELPPMLDYLIQYTFETAPYFLNGDPPDPKDETALGALAAHADATPWEFPSIADRVREAVRAHLADAAHAADREAIATLSEFTCVRALLPARVLRGSGRRLPDRATWRAPRRPRPGGPPRAGPHPALGQPPRAAPGVPRPDADTTRRRRTGGRRGQDARQPA